MTHAIAPLPKPTRADPAKEYVAGGSTPYSGYMAAARALPQPIDDLAQNLRSDIYCQMKLDSHVNAVTTIFRASIVGDGLETVPAVDEKDPEHALAQQIADECAAMLQDMATPTNELLYQYTDAMNVGNKIGELVWELRDGKLVVKDIKIKPRTSTAFVVDPFMNVLGLLAVIPGQYPTLQAGNYLTALPGEKLPNLLPREKFAIFSWHPEYNDPRGTSILRAVYAPWWSKTQLEVEYLKYMSQFASPSVVGTLAEGATDQPVYNADGTPLLDTNGNPTFKTAAEAMADGLINLRNGTYIVIPYGATVQPLITTGDGRAFDVAFHTFNRDIVLGVLTQTLATGEGEHASRAQAGVHQDALQTIVKQGKQGLCGMIEQDIYKTYVRYNYGEDKQHLTPRASLGDASEVDYAPRWTALASLMSSKYLDASQYAKLDVENGLPQRSEDSVKLAIQMQQQAAQLAMNPPTPPQPGQEQKQGGKDGQKDGSGQVI